MTLQVRIIIIAVLVAVISGFGLYVKHLIASNAEMKIEIKELKQSLSNKEKEIVQLKADYSVVLKTKTTLEIKEKNLKKEYDELNKKFNKIRGDGTKRDIGALILNKPDWMEKIINKGSKDVLECFETVTNPESEEKSC